MPYRILVIEDNSADVVLLEDALNQAGVGFEIHLIVDGQTAQRYIEFPNNAPPDLVLLDLHLPRIDGVELLQLMRHRASFKKVPIIVWSSLPSPKDRLAISQFKGTHLISKPSSFEAFLELGAQIGKVLNSNKVH